jgi:ABC-type Fe3+/spermidine/putrescine transport system ATPase subunit
MILDQIPPGFKVNMLELRNIQKTYEGQLLLHGISFTVAPGETVCLLGPSGSGKSTLLRIIAGLENAEQGDIFWDGENIASIPVHQRRFGLMFQDYALFPHKSVRENIAFGLEMQKLPRTEIDQRVTTALTQVNLTGFESRRVTDLSGGEQQRVALARARAPDPRLLMFDEPLGALDRTLREHLGTELREILHKSGVPAIYVTHDQEEAFTIADTVMLLHDGHIVQSGAPDEVYSHPASGWVAEFLGLGNLLTGVVRRQAASQTVQTGVGTFSLKCGHAHHDGEQVHVLIRPAGASLGVEATGRSVRGSVTDILFHQSGFKVTLDNGLYFYLPAAPKIGERVAVQAGSVECLG